MDKFKTTAPGLILCLILAIPCTLLGKLFPVVGGPVFAIISGMILAAFIRERPVFKNGLTFTSKKVLQYAVILLGFGLNLGQVVRVGIQSLPVIISTIATSLIVSYILCRLLHIPSKISTLVGVGSSICGGSAIAAAAPVINADEEEIAQSISVIFLFNIIAALIFPSIGQLLGLSNEGFALFAGTAVNDTSSVTAAASSWEEITGATGVLASATTVKLTRTLAIIPICLVLAVITAKKESTSGDKVSLKRIFPMFIIWFVAASFITTFLPVPEALTDFLKELSKFFIVMAMAAIGLNTDLIKLIRTGAKPLLLGFCCWIAITVVSLTMQHLLGIF